MTNQTLDLAGTRVLMIGRGPRLAAVDGALDLVGEGLGAGAHWVVVPCDRLPPEFFRLRSGFAGEVLQKFVQYQLGLAVVGDLTEHVAAGGAFADLVRESNRGRQAWFLPDLAAVTDRLGPPEMRNPVAGGG
jgi:hypothetical protein